MIKDMIYRFIMHLSAVHDLALELNDIYRMRLSDKDLHFWFFGAAGALVFLAAWALFKWLRDRPGLLAWLFSFVLVLMLALAVEVGQWLTGTGAMQLSDIAAGMIGYCALSLAAGVLFGALGLLRRLLRRGR